MDFLDSPMDILCVATIILVILLNINHSLAQSSVTCLDDVNAMDIEFPIEVAETSYWAHDVATRATLQHFRLFNTLAVIDEDLGFWVKPRSTTWFSRFLIQKYDDARWVQMFRMTKRSVFSITHLLAPVVRKKDTRYRLAVPVTVRIACTLFKLSHGASLLIYSELFAIGRSTVSIILREVVHALNETLREELRWPRGQTLASIAAGFENLCGLPGVLGAIDGTHIAISKPRFAAGDYYYFKSGGYTMNCQAVVDSDKRFLDLYVGMPGSTNDSRMLRRSTLFHRGQRQTLWDANLSFSGFFPYLLGDAGYPLLPWLMVPHRRQDNLPIADQLFNRKLSKGRVVVENAFGLLKLTFRELLVKTDLHVTFIPDVVMCCVLLHNVLLKQSHEEVERLLDVLRRKEAQSNFQDIPNNDDVVQVPIGVDVKATKGRDKRWNLGVHLSLQRIVPT